MGIRKIEQEDFEQWSLLWKAYQSFYKVSLNDELSKLSFTRLVSGDETMGGFVYENEQKLIGFVHYIFHKSTWSEGDSCYLQDLFVDDHSRSKGIGKELIEAVYAEAKNQQCSKVYWLTHESNSTARILYDRIAENVGFIQYRKNL